MRTTLAIDDDVLTVARDMARQQRRSVGDIMSELARGSLRRGTGGTMRNGIMLLPISNPDAVVTSEMIKRLGDELE